MLAKQYTAMLRGDWEATARQFYTGNASLRREPLLAVGGFDTAFRRAEDVEMAYRLDDRGIKLGLRAGRGRAALRRAQLRRLADDRVRLRTQRRRVRPRRRPALRLRVDHRRLSKPPLCRCGSCSACVFPAGGWRTAVGGGLRRLAELSTPHRPFVRDAVRPERDLHDRLLPGRGRRARSPRRCLWALVGHHRRGLRCDMRHTSGSCSSRRSGTSPTPTTCGDWCRATTRSMPRSSPSSSRSTGWRREFPAMAIGPSAPACGRDVRVRRGRRGSGRSTRCSSTPRSPPCSCPICSGAHPPSSRSTPRRGSTTSSVSITRTPPAARRVEQLKWRANRRLLRACRPPRHVGAVDEGRARRRLRRRGRRRSRSSRRASTRRPGRDRRRASRRRRADPVRILFVGGDLGRKGGNDLVEAFRRCVPTRTSRPSSCTW